MSRLPLKYKSGNDVQEITTAEHNHLAYLAGLELETVSGTYDQSALGSLGKTQQSGDLNVGSFTNTEYNGNVGDHGTLSITTTSTPIYLQDASVSIHADFRNPLYQKQTSGQQEIQEFNDTDQKDLGETLAGIIYTNDYPGTFYLGSSAPSSDYSVAIANVMTDTRTTGADIVYNIYQRHTMTPPTAIGLMAVARGSSSPFNASTGDYKGLIIMADSHKSKTAKGCLDRHLSTITSVNRPIGSYLIRSSSQGAPTQTGTWVAKGTATDTRNAIEDENYTSQFAGAPVYKTFISTFSGTYTSTSNRVTRTSNIETPTTSTNPTFPSTFTGTYLGEFSSNFTGTTTQTTTYSNINSNNHWQVTSSTPQDFFDGISVKVGGVEVASAGPSNTSDTTLQGTSNGKTYNRGSAVSGAPSGSQWYSFTESEDVPATFVGTRYTSSTSTYAGTKSSTFTGTNYSQQDFTTQTTKSFVGTYSSTFSSTSTPQFTGTFVGDTIQNTSANIETYTLYVRTA